MIKKVLWSQRKKEIICSLESMFVGVEHSVSVWKTRNGVNVYVCYEDFVTEAEMTERIKSIAGEESSITVVRNYSDSFVKDILYGLLRSNKLAVLYTKGSELDAMPMSRYVGGMMSGISRGEHSVNFSL